MQKLVWQNANGDTIDLTSGSYGITEWEGFSNASLNIQSQQVPFQDGAVFLDALIEPRELSVTLAMQDNNDLELRYQLRRELIHKLNPKLGEGYLIYTNDFISKRIKCVAQIPLFETHNSNDSGTPKASLSWTACEPYWEDLEETVVSISGLNTIQNEGDVSAQVEIIIPPGTSNPAIVNRKNQKQIKLLGDYDDTIEINTNLGQKSIINKKIDFTWVSGGFFWDVIYSKGLYVYVGSQIVIENNLNGKITSVKYDLTHTLRSITYSKELDLFVTVGDDGTILTSSDGITWTARTSGTSYALWGITYSNNLFVTVGYNGTILTSSDGITWTARTSGINLGLQSVEYFNNLFIAVGSEGTILTSPDGITWTSRTSGTSYGLYEITHSNNLFVTVGNSGAILTSSDGINWTIRTSGTNNDLRGTVYSKELDLFVAVGTNGTILTSSDGITWIRRQIGTNVDLASVIYNNNQYLIVGVSILTSSDGINWKFKNKSESGFLYDVTYSKELDLFVTVGSNGTILTSSDGINWTIRISGINYALSGITYGNNLFIAVGNSGTILTSPDGITWTSRTSGTSKNLNNVVYGNNQFVIMSLQTTILTSPDGITWTAHEVNYYFGEGLAYGNNLFVIVCQTGVILTSSDGINWTIRISGISYELYGVTYGDNLFVIVGDDGTILTSSDGITWIRRLSGNTNGLYEITYGNNLFVAVGYSETILNSYISETLNLISDLTPDSDMTFNLEVGNNDILYSDDNGNGATLKFRQKYIGV